MMVERYLALLVAIIFFVAASTCSAATAPRRALQFGGIVTLPEGATAFPILPPGFVSEDEDASEDEEEDGDTTDDDEDGPLTKVQAPDIPQNGFGPPRNFDGRQSDRINAISSWSEGEDEGFDNVAFSQPSIGEILYARPAVNFERRQISLMNNGNKIFAISPDGTVGYVLHRDGNKLQRLDLDFSGFENSYMPSDDVEYIDMNAVNCSTTTEIAMTGDDFVFNCGNIFMLIDKHEESELSEKVRFATAIGSPAGLFSISINGTDAIGAYDNEDKSFYISVPPYGNPVSRINVTSGGELLEGGFVGDYGCTAYEPHGIVCAIGADPSALDAEVGFQGLALIDIVNGTMAPLNETLTFSPPLTTKNPRVVHSRDPERLYFADDDGLFLIKRQEVAK